MRLRFHVKSSISMINYNMKSIGTIAKVVYSVHLIQNLNNVITTVFLNLKKRQKSFCRFISLFIFHLQQRNKVMQICWLFHLLIAPLAIPANIVPPFGIRSIAIAFCQRKKHRDIPLMLTQGTDSFLDLG